MDQPTDHPRAGERAARRSGHSLFRRRQRRWQWLASCRRLVVRRWIRWHHRLRRWRRPVCVWRVAARCRPHPARNAHPDRCYVDRRRGFFALVQGRGRSAVAAERASQTVVEVLAEWFGDVPDQPEIAWVRLTRRLRHALYAAHDELGEVLGQPPARSAVGSVGAATAVALIRARHLLTADVGGRAVFLLRGGELQGLAASDSSPPEMLTGEAAAARRLGASRPLLGCSQLGPDLWIRRYPLRPGDRLLLASRGVTDVLAAEELAAVLSGAASAVEVADELTELALEAGAHEDATCIVLDVVRA